MSYSGKFKDKNNNLHPVTSVLYGTCDTAAATAAKVVTCTDFDTLMTGVTIRVKFANANTAASPTVNINSTGEKSVYRFGSTAPVDGNSWNAGEVVELVYDGTSFFMTGADDIAAKQDATDNSLETTDKTIVGAINEHEGDVSSLMSGLTTLDNEVNGDATTYPYADVITIEDAVPSNLADCNVKIEPVQDLHGQGAPYVGGAGKNKCPLTVDSIKALNSGLTWNGNTAIKGGVPFTILTDSDNNVLGIKALGTSTAQIWYFNVAHITTTETMLFNTGNTYSWDGNKIVCEVTDGTNTYHASTLNGVEVPAGTYDVVIAAQNNATVDVTFLPMFRATTETDATFAPYTNLCPITGHTEASVQRDGVNQWDEEWELGGIDDTTGEKAPASAQIRSKNYIPCQAETSYYVASPSIGISIYVYFYGSNQNFIGRAFVDDKYSVIRKTITTPENCSYMMLKAGTLTTYNNDISINYPSTNTDYEPYAGKTYTIALGDTIYGGTVDFNTGVMTVTHGIADLGELSWSYNNGYFQTTSVSNLIKKPSSNKELVSAICEAYSVNNWNDINNTDNGQFAGSLGGNLVFVNTAYTTTSDFKTAMNGVKLCYELATPTTIQLTPQQIQLLQGQNTITASTGDISVSVNGVAGAIGSLTSDKQDKTDYALETTAKTVVGAINEVKNGLGNLFTTIEFEETTSVNGNIALYNYYNVAVYTLIAASVRIKSNGETIVAIPYQQATNRPGRVCGIHCISELANGGVIAETTVAGTLFLAKI